jgi:DNA-binding response OmpR family regulator
MTKIMLVEDDKSLREIYGVRLQAEGYDIKSAGDGEEALAMAIKEHPDLILSDVMMPKISGFDMLDILRSTPETKDIKVIMMTALSSEDQRARGETLGANRYLVKSQVGIEDVVRTIHDLLGDAPNSAPAINVFSVPVTNAPVATPTSLVIDQPTEQVLDIPATTLTSTPEPITVPQPTAPFSTPMTTAPVESMPPITTLQDAPEPTPAPTVEPTQDIPAETTTPVEPTPELSMSDLINQELNSAAPTTTPPQI